MILLPCLSVYLVVFYFLGKLFSTQTKLLLEAKGLGSHAALLAAWLKFTLILILKQFNLT